MRKTMIRSIPYIVIAVLMNKLCLAFRLTPGNTISDKLISLKYVLNEVFLSLKFSFHPADIVITVIAAGGMGLILYTKRQNAKKYRKGVEYGSARWSA